jgi:hypothetical protein
LAADARSFVSALTSKWSDSNAAALGGLDALYAAQVVYFGKRLSRGRVLADKRRFVQRWPERTYKIQSSHEQCSGSECLVEGYVEWETRNPARKARASGAASFRYVLLLAGGAFVIREEDGSVIQRRSRTPYQPEPAIAKNPRHDAIDGENARDQQLQSKGEIESPPPILIEEDERRVLADSHQLVNLLSQAEPTPARETYPNRNARSTVFDARLIPAAALILSFIVWRAARWNFRKSKSKVDAEARANGRTEWEGERRTQNDGRRSRTFACGSARGRWSGAFGSRMKSNEQPVGAQDQEDLECGWQELREAVREDEAEHQWQRNREQATSWEPEAIAWWSVLEVSPAAGKDEIVRSYRRKIQRCHPDRVCGLAPEFVLLAEKHTKTLNDAYAQAIRARR